MVKIGKAEGHSYRSDVLGVDAAVIDLGMNRGEFANFMAHKHASRVYGVEPVPDLFAALPKHPLIRAQQAAVTGGEESVTLHISPSRCASLIDGDVGAQAVEVKGVTLGSIMDENDLGEVALVKVDIEGVEIAVIDSLSDDQLLRIQQLTVEYHDFLWPEMGPDIDRVHARLLSLGYQAFNFSRDRSDILYLRSDLAVERRDQFWMRLRYHYIRGAARVFGRKVLKRRYA